MAFTTPPTSNWTDKIISGYEGIFRFGGKIVGHVSNIPAVGILTRVPVTGLRSFVEGHDEVRAEHLAKKIATGKMPASQVVGKIFSKKDVDKLREEANQSAGA